MTRSFPPSFDWGVATTAIQIEGGLTGTGRGDSMWPAFAAQDGNIKHNDSPAGSATSYHYLDRDLAAIKELGLKSYNFSPSWPRLLPEGAGRTNQEGLDYYNHLIDGLLEIGVSPNLSLYDWDLPLAYAEAGGWEERELADRFSDYVDLLIRTYGDRVTEWMTFNEVSTQATHGYKDGGHAPGRSSTQGFLKAYHHLLLAHGRSVQQLREASEAYRISMVENMMQYYPATVSELDRSATRRQWQVNNYYPLDAVFRGEVTPELRRFYTEEMEANFDHVRDGDMDTIKQRIDKLGINYFTAFQVAAAKNDPEKREKVTAARGPQSPFGWTIDPDGMLDALRLVKDKYTGDLPLFIGECGIGQVDFPDPDGSVRDPERIDYLKKHLRKVLQAIDEGIPIKGFYVWSLMDNFEWDDGYVKRFGLYYTQYHQPEKYLIKDSGKWFAELIRTNELPA